MMEAPDVTRPHRFLVQSSHVLNQGTTSQPVKQRPYRRDSSLPPRSFSATRRSASTSGDSGYLGSTRAAWMKRTSAAAPRR
jgi:hypothetical protein